MLFTIKHIPGIKMFVPDIKRLVRGKASVLPDSWVVKIVVDDFHVSQEQLLQVLLQ